MQVPDLWSTLGPTQKSGVPHAMPSRFLSDEQRARYGRYAGNPSEEQLGALGLTLNAIALWNSTYIQAALDQLTQEGGNISQPDIARVSPLAFKHINFLGRYAFDLPQAVAEGALRPLRNPNSE